MTVYVVLWHDRHSDTTAHVFSSEEKALEWARQRGKEFDRFGDYSEESFRGRRGLCPPLLYSISYSCEGDGLTVMEAEIDGELKKASHD